MKRNHLKQTMAAVLSVVLIGVVAGCSRKEQGHEDEGDGTKYTCSMHPQVMQDEPGNCPICGMTLVPVKKTAPAKTTDLHSGHDMDAMSSTSGKEQENPSVHLESAKSSVLSARTMRAEKRSLIKEVQLFGEMMPIADRETMYSWYYDGRVEDVLIDFNTTEVEKGQPLLKVYSEAAIADQEMYLKLLRERWLRTFYERDNLTMQIQAVGQRLKQVGMTSSQLKELEKNKTVEEYFTIRAPRGGSLIGTLPRVGMRFKSMDTLLRIAPLREIWFVADVFEKDMAYVKLGQKLSVKSKAHPDESSDGEVVYIDRKLNPETRTVEVRVLVPNKDLIFLPNLSAVGTLRVRLGEVAVAIPPSAIIETGSREVVYVEAGPGHYEQRQVALGARSEDWIEVKSGVEAGEKVVIEGAFLIDAEAQLKGGTSTGHDH